MRKLVFLVLLLIVNISLYSNTTGTNSSVNDYVNSTEPDNQDPDDPDYVPDDDWDDIPIDLL